MLQLKEGCQYVSREGVVSTPVSKSNNQNFPWVASLKGVSYQFTGSGSFYGSSMLSDYDLVREHVDPTTSVTVTPEWQTRTTQLTVSPTGTTVDSCMATQMEIVDDGAGEYVRIKQGEDCLTCSKEEWPLIKAAIDQLMGAIDA